jgi:uncharacterized protein (TIGR00266 family)
MPIKLQCECGKQFQLKDDLMGKRIRCTGCQAILLVAEQAPRAEEDVYRLQDEPEPTARPRSPAPSRQRSALSYEIIGNDMQMIEFDLAPGDHVVAEAGAMTYMEDDIEFTAKMGDGSDPDQGFFGKLLSAGKRVLSGESVFMTHFTNTGLENRRLAFAAPYPGRIVPMNLKELGGELICQKGAFLCATLGTKIDIAFQKKLGAGFFGGEGFILQRLIGKGLVFVHACGAILARELGHESLRVDTGCVVAFTNDIDYDIQRAGNLKSMLFGGEGLFLAQLTGPGKVWLQSLPFSRLADRITTHAGSRGGPVRDATGLLGGLGDKLGDVLSGE